MVLRAEGRRPASSWTIRPYAAPRAKTQVGPTVQQLSRPTGVAREPIDDYAAWDARLGSLAKADAEPLTLRMVPEGRTWARAA